MSSRKRAMREREREKHTKIERRCGDIDTRFSSCSHLFGSSYTMRNYCRWVLTISHAAAVMLWCLFYYTYSFIFLSLLICSCYSCCFSRHSCKWWRSKSPPSKLCAVHASVCVCACVCVCICLWVFRPFVINLSILSILTLRTSHFCCCIWVRVCACKITSLFTEAVNWDWNAVFSN